MVCCHNGTGLVLKEHTFWTDGYFACSVGNVSEEMLKRYIENQGWEREMNIRKQIKKNKNNLKRQVRNKCKLQRK